MGMYLYDPSQIHCNLGHRPLFRCRLYNNTQPPLMKPSVHCLHFIGHNFGALSYHTMYIPHLIFYNAVDFRWRLFQISNQPVVEDQFQKLPLLESVLLFHVQEIPINHQKQGYMGTQSF